MTEPDINARDYPKDRVRRVPFYDAMNKAAHGWVIARESWPKGQIVFLAKEGTFVAADLTTGFLDQFLVLRTQDGRYEPFVPSQSDIGGADWACITRQTFQRQMPTQVPERTDDTAQPRQGDVGWQDYPVKRENK